MADAYTAPPWIPASEPAQSSVARALSSPVAGAPAKGASAQFDLTEGDSIGVGFKRFGGLSGNPVGGRNPQAVLENIARNLKSDPNYYRGKTTILSSGTMNDPQGSMTGFIPQEIKAIQNAGGRVVLAGADTGKFANRNTALGTIANEAGVPFAGPLPTNNIHPDPKGYAAYVGNAAGRLGMGRAVVGAGIPAGASAPTGGASHEGTVAFWMNKGAPQHVAEGIADRVRAESGFNPTIPGDNGTSIGLYQDHADRQARLMALPNWQNPMVQHENAYREVTGGDSIAAAHWKEILAAPDRKTAAALWDKYFERSAGSMGGGGGAPTDRRMVGRFGGMGPRVPGAPLGSDDVADSASPQRSSPLAAAMTPSPAPMEVQAQPEQAAAQAPIAQPAFHMPPAAAPQMANLRNLYRTALGRIFGATPAAG